MKIQKLIYAVLMLLPLPVTLVALAYLPDRIPAHYGADYQVDRWGSKYESLIFPILAILFGLLLLAIAKYSEKQGKGNERISRTFRFRRHLVHHRRHTDPPPLPFHRGAHLLLRFDWGLAPIPPG